MYRSLGPLWDVDPSLLHMCCKCYHIQYNIPLQCTCSKIDGEQVAFKGNPGSTPSRPFQDKGSARDIPTSGVLRRSRRRVGLLLWKHLPGSDVRLCCDCTFHWTERTVALLYRRFACWGTVHSVPAGSGVPLTHVRFRTKPTPVFFPRRAAHGTVGGVSVSFYGNARRPTA